MDKLKNILKSDTPTGDEPTQTSGKLSGQGSHFPGKEETSAYTGSTVTGTEPSTRGPADVSAAPASSTAAAVTRGPEQGGSGHIGTAPASTAQPSTSQGIQDYSVSSSDFPKTQTSTGGSGTAAVGQTSTYSSSHLTRGDPTSSVVDPASSDPLTYKKPESGSHATEAAVGGGAAATAAGLAFSQGEERKMAGSENPYRTTQLDPRVDGLSKDSANIPGPSTTTSDHRTGSGAATGLASAGAATAYGSGTSRHESAAVPSSLTTTSDPSERSAEYQKSTDLKGLGSGSGSLTDTTTPASNTTATDSNQGIVGKVLGAVGLGGVVGGLGAGAASTASGRDDSAVVDTPEQPTTTTGLDSYTAPTQQGAPTGHHRKESIPTTAYPSATFDSPRAINPPIGGAGSPVVHGDKGKDSHTGRDVAVGTAAGGAALGAAAVGAHEHDKSRSLGEGISGQSSGSPAYTQTGTTATIRDIDARHGDPQSLGGNITGDTPTTTSAGLTSAHHATTFADSTTSSPVATAGTTTAATSSTTAPSGYTAGSSVTHPTESEKDHTARNTAIGAGAGAAAVGAGAYGAHEYSKREAERSETEAAREQAAREKEVARQRAEQEKELEKQHKADEKAAAKEEKAHQKELEKEEKKHQKEVEKEEKKHQKELEKEKEKAEEKQAAVLKKRRDEEEEERRKREERERLAGAAAAGGATGAYAEQEKEKEKEKEKKPSIFKRIFKRRKNSAGEEEEYSSDDDSEKVDKSAVAAYGTAIATGGGAATYQAERRRSSTSGTAGATKYEQASGGVQKPSYNPLAKDEPAVVTSAHDQSGPTTATATTGTAASTGHAEAITGLPYDASKDTEAARRLSEHTRGAGIGTYDKTDVPSTTGTTGSTGATGVTSTTGTTDVTGTTGTSDATKKDSITGLPYDASKDTEAARRLSEHTRGAGIGTYDKTDVPSTTGTTGTTGTSGATKKESITGLPYDPSKDPAAAARLEEHTHGEGIGKYDPKDTAVTTASTGEARAPVSGTGTTTTSGTTERGIAPSTLESSNVRSAQPTEAVTGTPSSSAAHGKPAAGTYESTGVHTQQPAGAVTGIPKDTSTTGITGTTGHAGEYTPNTNFTLGEVKDDKHSGERTESQGGLGEKIKDVFHLGSHKKEGEY